MSNSIMLMPIQNRTSKFGTNAKDDTSKWEYTLTGSTDKATVETFCLANLPKLDGHRTLDTFSVKEKRDHRDGHWRVVANYKGPTLQEEEPIQNPTVKEISVGFSVGGQSQFMSHSLETIASYASPGFWHTPTAPDFNNQINLVDGVPEGVDVSPQQMAEFSFTVEQEVPTVLVTNAWIKAVQDATNKTNDATFRGRAAGEVLFYGMRGTVKLREALSTLTWEFLGIENKSNETIGEFAGVDKKGWEYAWVYSEEREKTVAVDTKKIVHSPVALYVERLFDSIDMTTCGVSA